MSKLEQTEKEKLKDLIIAQMQLLRMKSVQMIADIDEYEKQIERRFKKWQ